MSREWYKYKTYESWANLLQELLEQAQRAVSSGDADSKREAMEELEAFIDNSPMSIPQTKELDDIAEKAARQIWEGEADKVLALLRQDLGKIQRIIRLATQKAEEGNLSRRYELTAGVVTAANETIKCASELAKSFEEGESPAGDLASDIRKLVATIQKLRDKVELVSK